MCSDNPNLLKEANKAKCFAVACFVFSVFSMLGFFAGITGVIGAICGLLACVAASILMCCGPKSTAEGSCKYTAAGVLFLIAGLVQIIACIILLVQLVAAINHADDSSYCDDRYSKCTSARVEIESIYFDADSLTLPCTDGWCYQDPDDLQDTQACSDAGQYDSCKTIHKGGKAVVTGILVIVFGATAAFLLIAGLLNTLGGVYCFGAKKAIEAASKSSPQAAVAVVGTQLPQA